METMTVTNEKTLQQGLNDVVINKVQRMIDGKSVGGSSYNGASYQRGKDSAGLYRPDRR